MSSFLLRPSCALQAKVPYFFSRKSSHVTHSLDCTDLCFFFFQHLGKKTIVFFFSQEKFASYSHLLENFHPQAQATGFHRYWKKWKSRWPWAFQVKVSIFSESVFFSFVFFFLEKFTLHSLTQSQKPENSTGKKNSIFTHSLDFVQKVVKNELFLGNKKIRYL